MLRSLEFDNVGPVQKLTASFGERLNVFTGDNGLGKSFLLDACFWALTGAWPGGRTAIPESGKPKIRPTITYEIQGRSSSKREPKVAKYDFSSQTWVRPIGRPFLPGLVIYAAADGGFAVWDPARNYWRDPSDETKAKHEQARSYQFDSGTLAYGLSSGDRLLCNGLVQDWVNWYYEKNSMIGTVGSAAEAAGVNGSEDEKISPFSILEGVVRLLSHPLEPMTCGVPSRVFVDQPRKYPVLNMPYGSVAYPQWSAGVKRIIHFAYLLIWSWYEHCQAAALREEPPTQRLIVIVDEIEAHLHPKWQRTIVPALLEVVQSLQSQLSVQTFIATHSPLILASLEAGFDRDRDKLFWFNLVGKRVEFQEYPWAIQGDVTGWLTSEIFGLKQARSREAEIAVEAAEAFMRGAADELPDTMKTKQAIHAALLQVLPGLDPFWPRWIVKVKP